MWNALKSDLLDFVNIIQADTTNTLIKVLGDNEDSNKEGNEKSLLDKLIADCRRSYETYANPIQERRAKEYDRFFKKFSLSDYAQEISKILDEEDEVPRFYAELVPIKIKPEEFWSRLFFRLHLLSKNGSSDFDEDDDDEEALRWELEEELEQKQANDQSTADTAEKPTIKSSDKELHTKASRGDSEQSSTQREIIMIEQGSQCSDDFSLLNDITEQTAADRKSSSNGDSERVRVLEEENASLRAQIDKLRKRIETLEAQLELESWGDNDD